MPRTVRKLLGATFLVLFVPFYALVAMTVTEYSAASPAAGRGRMPASTGICVVQLSSFWTELKGFRITLLEQDEERLTDTFRTVADSITAYLASSTTATRPSIAAAR